MNTAQSFNEDGQRILPERLYSPFIRMPVLAQPRKVQNHMYAVRKNLSPWYDAICGALRGGKILDINSLYDLISETGTKGSMQKQISKMKQRGEIIALGKFPQYAYRLPG